MEISEASRYLALLARGIHPVSGANIHQDTTFQEPLVRAALATCAAALRPQTTNTDQHFNSKHHRSTGATNKPVQNNPSSAIKASRGAPGTEYDKPAYHQHPQERRVDFVLRRKTNIEQGRSPKAGFPWSAQDRHRVSLLFNSGSALQDIANRMERSLASIIAELTRQNLIDDHGSSINLPKPFIQRVDIPQVTKL